MKLYATITSERASKGQGGKNLKIIINIGKQTRYIIGVTDEWITLDNVKNGSGWKQQHTKGKKQKGEVAECKNYAGRGWICKPNCKHKNPK